MLPLWLKKYMGLIVAVVLTLACFAAIVHFHIRSSDVQKALDRPLPVIKEVDPNVIEVKMQAAPVDQKDQSTPSATKESTRP